MDWLWNSIVEKVKEVLISGLMAWMGGMFDDINGRVSTVATQVGTSPVNFSPEIFSMIRNVSETVIMPIAGLILTFIACYELIQMVIDRNNLANFETWIFFKWVFKTFVAVMLITNTFDITMAVFDVAQNVISSAGGLITQTTKVDSMDLAALETTLKGMDIGPLLGMYVEVFFIRIGIQVMSLIVFVIVYGRMLEIYLMVSLAPIPFSTFGNREQSHIGQNYLRSICALGFQGFLILICVGIYAVLIHSVSLSSNPLSALWGVLGYTLLLCFSLFHTGNLARSVFSAH